MYWLAFGFIKDCLVPHIYLTSHGDEAIIAKFQLYTRSQCFSNEFFFSFHLFAETKQKLRLSTIKKKILLELINGMITRCQSVGWSWFSERRQDVRFPIFCHLLIAPSSILAAAFFPHYTIYCTLAHIHAERFQPDLDESGGGRYSETWFTLSSDRFKNDLWWPKRGVARHPELNLYAQGYSISLREALICMLLRCV